MRSLFTKEVELALPDEIRALAARIEVLTERVQHLSREAKITLVTGKGVQVAEPWGTQTGWLTREERNWWMADVTFVVPPETPTTDVGYFDVYVRNDLGVWSYVTRGITNRSFNLQAGDQLDLGDIEVEHRMIERAVVA